MPDIFARLYEPYRRLVSLERLWRLENKHQLTALEYAAIHVARGYEVLLKEYDADTAGIRHLELSDRFRALLVDLARKGGSLQDLMARRSILQTIDSMLEDVNKHQGPVQ